MNMRVDYIDYVDLVISVFFISIGIWAIHHFSKKYSIKVKGKCIYSHVGYHTNSNRFSYVIDGKEYEGKGRCCLPKRKGKIYNLRVNKDNLEDFMTFPMMFGLLIAGLLELSLALNIVW